MFKFLNNILFLSLKIVFVLANREDPDKMTHFGAFHLGLHCLPKYPFRGYSQSLQRVKRLKLETVVFYLLHAIIFPLRDKVA